MQFKTFSDGMEYVKSREKQMGKMKYRSSPEYRELHPQLQELYKMEGLKPSKKRRVEIRICLSA